MMDNPEYKSITSLEGLLGIRAKLSMYLGGTHADTGESPRALSQMLQETLSNSLDEHVAGYGSRIQVIRYADDTMGVFDEGRGIPITGDLDALIRAFSVPHSSGKFDDSAYSSLGVTGTHGIGMKAVNAASSVFTVVTVRGDQIGAAQFSRGEMVRSGHDTSAIELSSDQLEDVIDWFSSEDRASGTIVLYKPDTGPISDDVERSVLSSGNMHIVDIDRMLKVSAFLSPALALTFIDRKHSSSAKTYAYPNGISQYLCEVLHDDGAEVQVIASDILMRGDGNQQLAGNYIIAIAPSDDSIFETYVNGVKTSGGSHVAGIQRGVLAAVKDAIQDKSINVKLSDAMSAVAIIAHVRVPGEIVEFEGQTKDILAVTSITAPLKNSIATTLGDILFDDTLMFRSRVIENVLMNCSRRADLEKLREQSRTVRNAKRNQSLQLSSKLKKARSRKPEERELYLVEGDSASRIGRDPNTQAVLPLRGKVINAMKTDPIRVLKNTEISTIVATMGAGAYDDFDLNKIQYHKLIACADRDADGHHIQSLIIGMAFVLFPGFIEAGHMYVAEAPLFKATRYVNGKPEHKLFWSQEELDEHRPELEGWSLTRFKGLGEMNEDEARQTLANPQTRRLVQITLEDAVSAKRALDKLIGNGSNERRAWVFAQFGE